MTDKERKMINDVYDLMEVFEDEEALKIIHDHFEPMLFQIAKKAVDKFWLNGRVPIKIEVAKELIKEVKKELS